MTVLEVAPPGSEEAIFQGCTCPVIDNHYGRGIQFQDSVQYWYTAGCPRHDGISKGNS